MNDEPPPRGKSVSSSLSAERKDGAALGVVVGFGIAFVAVVGLVVDLVFVSVIGLVAIFDELGPAKEDFSVASTETRRFLVLVLVSLFEARFFSPTTISRGVQ